MFIHLVARFVVKLIGTKFAVATSALVSTGPVYFPHVVRVVVRWLTFLLSPIRTTLTMTTVLLIRRLSDMTSALREMTRRLTFRYPTQTKEVYIIIGTYNVSMTLS